MVDFTDTPQAPAGFDKANLVFIADHHKLGNVTSSSPLEAWILPYGSTATVLYQVYTYYGIPVPKDIAGVMLGAILSDTVIFRSATATDKDLESANALAKIAGVDDIPALGMKLFAIKSDISQTGSMELLQRDYKEFNMNGQKIGIAQLEMTDSTPALKRKAGFLSAMKDMKEKTHSQSVLFMLTDIMQGNTTLLVVSDNPQLIENAFSKKIVNDEMKLPGVMSRKKQLIPDLEKAFRK
ncbi:DHH family phosphoesterase [Oxalobacter formigenes]|uniref:DHH family phosphoesterase n=1 Tax=Oxalobacter formigenes TaxID=847 RepID=UPI00241DEFD6|nr:DHHA2 domain-containing protein [Oxalobacter formigenes]